MVRFSITKRPLFIFLKKEKKGLDISVFFCYTIRVVGIDLLINNHFKFLQQMFSGS